MSGPVTEPFHVVVKSMSERPTNIVMRSGAWAGAWAGGSCVACTARTLEPPSSVSISATAVAPTRIQLADLLRIPVIS